ncbi:hypothetical protein BH11MYX3_BH11MYX3_47520 [soil metagenome]
MLSSGHLVRFLGAILVLVPLALAACPGSRNDALSGAGGEGDDNGGAGNAPQLCNREEDCSLAAATCCDCPSFAVNQKDPAVRACTGVTCPGKDSCADNVHAACEDGMCVLACSPLACSASCAAGLAIDEATGCLSCACAVPEPNGCMADTDCVETRADCCGCHFGGNDTAVPASQRGAYDAQLGCPSSPACPVVNVCQPGAAPRCIQGRCELVVTSGLQATACGRDDLPACPSGQICTVNIDPQASLLGVGVCVPPAP